MRSYSQCLLRYAVCYNIVRGYFSPFRAYAGNGVIIRERAGNGVIIRDRARNRYFSHFTRALSPG